jgi:hypothetical protein
MKLTYSDGRAMIMQLVAGLSQQRPEFAPGSFHMEFVMEKLTLWSGFL